jgi:prepilin-type N-terminal cleavage/methylation domain-containing protein
MYRFTSGGATALHVRQEAKARPPRDGFSGGNRGRGFTIVELLVAMALIVLIMSVLSQAFVEGLETFRHLKALGDLGERLRESSLVLARDIDATNFESHQFIEDGLLTGTVDRAEAAALTERYEKIRRDACELQRQFREIKTDRREVLQAIEREVTILENIKLTANLMVELLRLLSPPSPDADA